MRREGDEHALRVLLDRHQPLLDGEVGRYFYLPGGDREDTAQEARIAFAAAVRCYCGGRGSSFRSFAKLCVSRRLASVLTAARRNKHSLVTDALAGEEAERVPTALPDRDDPVDLALAGAVRLLPARSRGHGPTSRAGASYTYDPNGNTLTEQGGNSFSYDPKGPHHTDLRRGVQVRRRDAVRAHTPGRHHLHQHAAGHLPPRRRPLHPRRPRRLARPAHPSNRYYPIADSLGSIVAVTDKDGNLVGRHDYEPFGAEQGSPAFTFRFAGELYFSVGIGPKASAGTYYREYLFD